MKKFLLLLPSLLLSASLLLAQGPSDDAQRGFAKPLNVAPSSERRETEIEPKIIRQETVDVPSEAVAKGWRPRAVNVDQWLSTIQQPGYRLLYKQQGSEYYAAVFVTAKHALVVATQPLRPDPNEPGYGSEFRIDAADGSDAGDWKRRVPLEIEYILHAGNGAQGDYFADAGWLVPVRGRSRGPLHIVMQKWKGPAQPRWTLLDCKIYWPPR